MKKYLALILIVFIGCKVEKKHDDKYYFPNGHVYLDSPKMAVALVPIAPTEYDFNRYFYITYLTALKNNSQFNYGEIWLSCNGFPSKTVIDSGIFSHLEYKRNCYQTITLTSIYEFKNKQDYNSFTANYKGDKSKKHKNICKEVSLFKNPIKDFSNDTLFTKFPLYDTSITF